MRLLRFRTGARKYTWFIALVVLVAISLMLVGAFVTSWTFITHGVAGKVQFNAQFVELQCQNEEKLGICLLKN